MALTKSGVIVDNMNMFDDVRRCLPKGTLVHTSGGLIPIEDVKPGMMARTSNGFSKISELVHQGSQDIVTIKNVMGDFHCTAKHKIAVMTSPSKGFYEWKTAQDLLPGDCMVFVQKNTAMGGQAKQLDLSKYPELAEPEIDHDMAWFLGMFSCAGICYDKRAYIFIDSSNMALVDRVVEQLDRFNVDINTIEPSHGHLYKVYAQSSQLSSFLSKISFKIPDFILTGDLRIRSAYLRGKFDSGLSDENHIPSNQAQLQALYASTGVLTNADDDNKTLHMLHIDSSTGLVGVQVFCVEHEGLQMETFDISVPGAKEFVAGPGLLVHNTAEIVFGDQNNDEYINLKNWAVNPCVAAWTMIHTDTGVFSVSDLLGKPFKAKVNGKIYDCYNGFFKTGTKELDTLDTEEGHSVDLTADHKVLTVMGWKKAQDLIPGDLILLNINRGERLIDSDVTVMQNAFYSNGSYVKNILTFHYEHRGEAKKLQTLLLKYGVNSSIHGTKLVVIGGNLRVFDIITQCLQILPWEELDFESFLATFQELTPMGEFDVYDCIVEEVHRFSANGIIVHNCLEQTYAGEVL